MGTDIHMVGERRWNYNTPGKWKMFPIPQQFRHRYYAFFAHLADVRNGFGFAGIKTHEALEPLTSHRGLPDDIGDQAKAWFDYDWGGSELYEMIGYPGEHSTGYATLEELMAHNWEQGGPCEGVISKGQYFRWDGKGPPKGACGAISGHNIEVLDLGHTRPGFIVEAVTHVKVSWFQRYLDSDFALKFIEFLENEADGDECRILFNFDS